MPLKVPSTLRPLLNILERTWAQDPDHRPPFDRVERELEALVRMDVKGFFPFPVSCFVNRAKDQPPAPTISMSSDRLSGQLGANTSPRNANSTDRLGWGAAGDRLSSLGNWGASSERLSALIMPRTPPPAPPHS